MLGSMRTKHKYTHSGTHTDMWQLKPFQEIIRPNLYPSLPRRAAAWTWALAGALGGGRGHVRGPAHLIGSLQGPLAVLEDGAEGDVGVLLHQLLHRHFIDLKADKSRCHAPGPLNPPAARAHRVLVVAPATRPSVLLRSAQGEGTGPFWSDSPGLLDTTFALTDF